MSYIASLISDGATTFLKTEYFWISVFVVIFASIIACTVEEEFGQFYTTFAFLLGAITSTVSGYIGMWVAVQANVRTAKMAIKGMDEAFGVAFKGGMVLGFTLVGLALCNLMILLSVYKGYYSDKLKMFEAVAGYGLGGSTVALFGRVGGGIYTKAADVGADLVGKVIEDMDEDSI